MLASQSPADHVAALVDERFLLETMLNENSVGDDDPLIEQTAARIGRLDGEIADSVATSAAGVVAQVRVLHEFGYGTFCDDDEHHPDGIADKLIATIAAGVERLAGSSST